MNCYTEIFNGFDMELIIYDQIYFNLTFDSKTLSIFWNNEQLWAIGNKVTDDKEKILQWKLRPLFFNALFHNVLMGVELYDLHQIKDNFISVILTSLNVYLKYIHRVLNDRIGLTLIFRANTVATANTAFLWLHLPPRSRWCVVIVKWKNTVVTIAICHSNWK